MNCRLCRKPIEGEGYQGTLAAKRDTLCESCRQQFTFAFGHSTHAQEIVFGLIERIEELETSERQHAEQLDKIEGFLVI